MKLAVLFSGGKDSTYATYLAKQNRYELTCLISILSENKESFMFHTPSIEKTKFQAKAMNIPLIVQKTHGKKEEELKDLEKTIKKAKEKYKIEGIITGAVESVYQASRVQKICDKLELECFNPLWQKNQLELLEDLIKNKFEVIITSVMAYPFNESWLGRKIDKKFIREIKELNEKYKINPAGEGGEFETFVFDCPLFKKSLKIKDKKIFGEKNSWSMEIDIK
jgi:ABC transporter with metal-binding/Fe-S-binding domain ATP-binding protein|tara:strand:- start:2172 stop:2840 length:669 start_codon:yes stop_codon:yes gene_type:complete